MARTQLKWILLVAAVGLSPVLYAMGKFHGPGTPPLQAVRELDMNRFLGTWYEIASTTNSFPQDCSSGIAQYNMAANGKIQMLNICRKVQTGQVIETSGLAEVYDRTSNAKMHVSYLPRWMRWTGFGEGQLWVIDLAPDYSYAVISEPGGRFVRIMSRTPSISKETYDRIGDHLLALNVAPDRLVSSRPNALTAR